MDIYLVPQFWTQLNCWSDFQLLNSLHLVIYQQKSAIKDSVCSKVMTSCCATQFYWMKPALMTIKLISSRAINDFITILSDRFNDVPQKSIVIKSMMVIECLHLFSFFLAGSTKIRTIPTAKSNVFVRFLSRGELRTIRIFRTVRTVQINQTVRTSNSPNI